MPKKPKQSKEVNTNEWMNTYSDCVTLLLCFFVLLFSMSTMNEEKWKALVKAFALDRYSGTENDTDIDIDDIDLGGITSGSNSLSSGFVNSGDVSDSGMENSENANSGNANSGYLNSGDLTYEDLLYDKLKDYVYQHDLESNIEVDHIQGEITIRFKDVILFNPDSAVLLPTSKPILDDICKMLFESKDLIDMIEIQGHTAQSVYGEDVFTTTFEFSTRRALTVLHYTVDQCGIDDHIICAVGYGQYHPIADNSTEEGRAKNRRVEIVIHSNSKALIIKKP